MPKIVCVCREDAGPHEKKLSELCDPYQGGKDLACMQYVGQVLDEMNKRLEARLLELERRNEDDDEIRRRNAL